MVMMNVRKLEECKEDRDFLDVESQESSSDISVVVGQKCLCPRMKYFLVIPGHQRVYFAATGAVCLPTEFL